MDDNNYSYDDQFGKRMITMFSLVIMIAMISLKIMITMISLKKKNYIYDQFDNNDKITMISLESG